ncbi:MAG: hypothetical protein NVV74_13330 [Magnetospirillum sp.]|nr:hypothetical protein [Magnetospirillum sp.]
MIPRIIHRVWLGGKPIPPQYDLWWEGWQRQLPDYEFISWTDKDIPSLSVRQQIEAADSGAKKADIARYEIMHRYGGTYLDCDFMPLNHLDFSAFDADLVVCHEREKIEPKCSNGFFSVSPNHPLMAKAVEAVTTMQLNAVEVIAETGPGFFGKLIAEAPYKRLPSNSFYPYLYNEPFHAVFPRPVDQTYGIHVWYNSWFTEHLRVLKLNSMLLSGDLEEIRQFCQNNPLDPGELRNVEEFISAVRSSRTLITDISRGSVMQRLLRLDDKACFELFKTGYFLLRRTPEAKVWHIGAGDGVAGSPLRALLVNFDPHAVLAESRPELAPALVRNHARHRNVTCLGPEAFGGGPAIDLDRLHAACGGGAPQILAVTLDGAGAQVIHGLFDRGALPQILYMKGAGWDVGQTTALLQRLAVSHEVVDLDNCSIAYRRDFFWDYCRDLFIEHGHPTVYRQMLDTLINKNKPKESDSD